MKKTLLSLTFTGALLISAHSHAQIVWGDAANITRGASIKASGLIEMRDAIDDLRRDLDGGGAGIWVNGAGGDVYYNGGDVGIGIANPDVKLDVAGAIQATSTIQAGTNGRGVALTVNDGYGNASVTWNHVAGRAELDGNAARIMVNTDATTNAYMNFQVASGLTAGVPTSMPNIMTLRDDGKVGIGTENPSSELEVAGNVTANRFFGNGSGLTGIAGDNLGSHSATQDLYINNRALVSAGGSNFDFIKHDDASNTWNFGSDRPDMNTGTFGGGTVRAGSFVGNGSGLTSVPLNGAILDNTPGNWEVVPNNKSTGFSSAGLEIREFNNAGSQTGSLDEAPRLSFHWGGRAASQIGVDASGTIRTFNNPGTDYEDFRAKNITLADRLTMSTAAASYIEATRVGTTDMINVVANDNIQLSTGSNTPRLRINGNGNVGIGTIAPSQKLHVAGNVLATAFLYSSDAKLKENVKTVSGLDSITKLRGVTFDWKANKKADVGLIAQEVETVYPELVTTDKEGLKSVQYGNLVAPLIEAIKEQQIQIEALQAEVNELKK